MTTHVHIDTNHSLRVPKGSKRLDHGRMKVERPEGTTDAEYSTMVRKHIWSLLKQGEMSTLELVEYGEDRVLSSMGTPDERSTYRIAHDMVKRAAAYALNEVKKDRGERQLTLW